MSGRPVRIPLPALLAALAAPLVLVGLYLARPIEPLATEGGELDPARATAGPADPTEPTPAEPAPAATREVTKPVRTATEFTFADPGRLVVGKQTTLHLRVHIGLQVPDRVHLRMEWDDSILDVNSVHGHALYRTGTGWHWSGNSQYGRWPGNIDFDVISTAASRAGAKAGDTTDMIQIDVIPRADSKGKKLTLSIRGDNFLGERHTGSWQHELPLVID